MNPSAPHSPIGRLFSPTDNSPFHHLQSQYILNLKKKQTKKAIGPPPPALKKKMDPPSLRFSLSFQGLIVTRAVCFRRASGCTIASGVGGDIRELRGISPRPCLTQNAPSRSLAVPPPRPGGLSGSHSPLPRVSGARPPCVCVCVSVFKSMPVCVCVCLRVTLFIGCILVLC